MVKSAYKKFLKQERAKVKLKGSKNKAILPKGQNVTDPSFKVKKLIIQSQLTEHKENEILSARKLNIQEVLTRLGHYSANVSMEAVGQLESILKSGDRLFLLARLSPIVNGLAKHITSSFSHLRKAAIKLLAFVLSQLKEGEWEVMSKVVVSYVVCGLSHVDPGVRADSLLALDACPSSASPDILLPTLLDLLSTSRPTGRSLQTPLSSPTAHRVAILSRIFSVLSSFGKSLKGAEEEAIVAECNLRVPPMPLFSDNPPFSISPYASMTTESQSVDLKEFCTSLLPLMMDSYAEIAPQPQMHEPVCMLTSEGLTLLSIVADILLLLHTMLVKEHSSNHNWMKNKFGNQFKKFVIDERFPYGEEVTNKKNKRGSSGQKGLTAQNGPSDNAEKLNLTLALLVLQLNQHSAWPPILQYLSGILRNGVKNEEVGIFEKCLSVCLSQSQCKPALKLLASLVRVNRSSPLHKEAFSVLSSLASNDDIKAEVTHWIEELLSEAASPDKPFYLDTIDFLKNAVPVLSVPQSSFDSSFPAMLDKAIKLGEDSTLFEIGTLLYWVREWDTGLLDLLAQLMQNETFLEKTKSHITHLILSKSQRYPELKLREKLLEHPFWKGVEQVTFELCY